MVERQLFSFQYHFMTKFRIKMERIDIGLKKFLNFSVMNVSLNLEFFGMEFWTFRTSLHFTPIIVPSPVSVTFLLGTKSRGGPSNDTFNKTSERFSSQLCFSETASNY